MDAVRTYTDYTRRVSEAAAKMHAAALERRRYAVLPDLLGPDEVQVVRGAVMREVEGIQPPALWARDSIDLGDGVSVTSTGLAIGRLLDRCPELERTVLPSALRAAMSATLGEDCAVELVGAVVSDRSRPFFSWHTHIDREDESQRVRAGCWPVIERVHRVLVLIYLDDVDDDRGPLCVLPRRVGEATAPPHPLDQERWPGMVEVRPRAGTAVALEQCLWHAVEPMQVSSSRAFVGIYFARSAVAARPAER